MECRLTIRTLDDHCFQYRLTGKTFLLHRFKDDSPAVHHCRNLRFVLVLKVTHPFVVAFSTYTPKLDFGVVKHHIKAFPNTDADRFSWSEIPQNPIRPN